MCSEVRIRPSTCMMRSDSIPTLLVFTLGPECERVRRRLLPHSLRSAELLLHRSGLDSTLAAGRRGGFRLVVASPKPLGLPDDVEQFRQRGRSFAERLRSTIRELHGRYPDEPLVVVGTDSPDLDASHLQEALSWLRDRPDGVVLGPAVDGGFYLLATRRPLDLELAAVQWCRSDTLHLLQDALSKNGRPVKQLSRLRDLDLPADLEVWLSRSFFLPSTRWLVRLLRSLLAIWRRPPVLSVSGRLQAPLLAAVSGRGPPI